MENKYKEEELEELAQLLSEIPDVEVPAEFDIRLKNALKMEASKKRRNKLKVITSIAAVFAVGLISYMAYDTIPVLPDTTEMTTPYVASAPSIEENEMIENTENSMPKNLETVAEDKRETPKTVEKKQPAAPGKIVPSKEKAVSQTSQAAQAVPERAIAPRMSGGESTPQSINSFSDEAQIQNKEISAELQYYFDLIEKEFEGQDFKIESYEKKNNGQWDFTIFLFSGNNGTIEEEEILIRGQDGTIEEWKKESL